MQRAGADRKADAAGVPRLALGFVAIALAPLVFRGLALLDEGHGAALADGRGALADAAVALVLLALLGMLARLARWIAVAVVGVLALAYYANFETILALGAVASPLDMSFLADPTFVEGSALAVARPLSLALVVLASLLGAWLGLRRVPIRAALVAGVVGGAGIVFLSLWPADARYTTWRQVNALDHNARWLAQGGLATDADAARGRFPDPPTAMLDLVPGLVADLDAPARLPVDARGRNVLLVVLEGVSGFYLPSAAELHGRPAPRPMRRLDQVFRENVGFSTFLTHQRRTNRGLYAILCGELPRLVSGMPKMTVAASGGWRTCLPEVLRDAGYRTVFLQAAPLAFMLKDRFMPRIGFEEVLGQQAFQHYYMQTKWGVDDRAFFERAFEMVEELESGNEPWFLTLLTVGTHHPYVVPASFLPGQGSNMQRAFAYLDVAIGEFLQRLERSGVRDDTLVLITSDESAGSQGIGDDALTERLTQNWGFAVAMLPERVRARVREAYAQQDVALSVLDHVGLAEQGREFFGRSMFRNYASGRPMFFSNLNHHTISGLDANGLLVHCQYEGDACEGYAAWDGRLFAPHLKPVTPDPAFVALVREMALRSRPLQGTAPLAIALLTDPVFQVNSTAWQMVQGVVEISLEPEQWLEVEIEAQARGSGAVTLKHDVRFSPGRYLMKNLARVEPGQDVSLRYTLAADQVIPYVSIRTHAKLADGHAGELVFKRRRALLRSRGKRPPAGIQVERFQVEPPIGRGRVLSQKLTPIETYGTYLSNLAAHHIGAISDEEDADER